jgi:hypothetical protein
VLKISNGGISKNSCKGKGKAQTSTRHEDQATEYKYSSTLSSNSASGGGGCLTSPLDHFTSLHFTAGEETRFSFLQKAEWAGSVWTGVKILAPPPTGFNPRTDERVTLQ